MDIRERLITTQVFKLNTKPKFKCLSLLCENHHPLRINDPYNHDNYLINHLPSPPKTLIFGGLEKVRLGLILKPKG